MATACAQTRILTLVGFRGCKGSFSPKQCDCKHVLTVVPFTSVGNDAPSSYPPATTTFPGSTLGCDAVHSCVVFAAGQNPFPFNYLSMNVYYIISTSTWNCIAYFDPSSPSDFNIADSDVGASYGYSAD